MYSADLCAQNTQVSQEREFRYSFYRNTYKRLTRFPAVTLQVHEGAGRAPKWTDVDEGKNDLPVHVTFADQELRR